MSVPRVKPRLITRATTDGLLSAKSRGCLRHNGAAQIKFLPSGNAVDHCHHHSHQINMLFAAFLLLSTAAPLGPKGEWEACVVATAKQAVVLGVPPGQAPVIAAASCLSERDRFLATLPAARSRVERIMGKPSPSETVLALYAQLDIIEAARKAISTAGQ